MKLNHLTSSLVIAGIVCTGLSACGGSNNSKAPTSIMGTAATGAAFSGGTVYVYDSRGQQVGSTSTIDANTGQYSLTLTEGAVAPFVLIASRTTTDGQTETLVSVMGSTDQTTANITPITSLIASRLSPSGDPNKLLDELSAGSATVSPTAIASAVTEIGTILAPLLTASGTSSSDPLTTSFTTDGTSYDRLLDSISVSFSPTSSTTTNIDITAKTVLADGQQPVTTSFTNTTSSVTPLDASLATATLVEPGTSTLINDFLRQLSTCYALPRTSRVSGTDAGSVTATECKNAFFGNDPSNFLSNGGRVGQGKAFNGLFVDGGTGVVFSQGTYEFSRPNGDIVAGYKSRDLAGNETFDTFVLRKDTDGKLKLIGNQYAYPGGVTAYHQLRQFISLNQNNYNYYSTGYAFGVSDVTSGGSSIFAKVVVTTPKGNTLVLKPSTGSSNLNLVYSNGNPSGTSFLRMARAYADTSKTTDPSAVDTKMFFSPTRYTDEQIQAIPSQSVWQFDYYLKTNATLGSATEVPNATQHYKTRARAMSIAELRATGLASLTPEMVTLASSAADPSTGKIVMAANDTFDAQGPGGSDAWSVAAGQLPPTQVTNFGNAPTTPFKSFDDSVKVGSTKRKTTVPCAPQSNTDDHCYNNLNGTYGPGYAAGSTITGLHLWARDVAGREFANFYALYKLTLPNP